MPKVKQGVYNPKENGTLNHVAYEYIINSLREQEFQFYSSLPPSSEFTRISPQDNLMVLIKHSTGLRTFQEFTGEHVLGGMAQFNVQRP